MASTKNSVIDATIGPRLLELCGARGVSFSELARRSEISRSTLTRILRGTRPAQPRELTRILKVLRVGRRDFFHPLVAADALTPEPTAALPDVAPVDVPALEHQLRLAVEQRDDLADQVERLCAELRFERAERVNELAELRDQHMREIAGLRNQFQVDLTKIIEETEAREEKARAAVVAVLAELKRHEQTDAWQSAGSRPERAPTEPAKDTSPTDGKSWIETAAGFAAGLGGLALGTWLLASKRANHG